MSFVLAPDALSAVPLASLPAVFIDTETTGLDPAHNRIIEIGAVRLNGVAGDADESYSTLVNPATSIPPSASQIHGIRDEDVTGAPRFREAMGEFANWVGPSVVIGFSLGFDLSVLKSEHKRSGLAWQAPRSLDVRHCVQLSSRELPELSLEVLAGWLGIPVVGRHRALADARLARDIFVALVPKLRERGIVTLAQAERASRELTDQIDQEVRAGWHQVGRPDSSVTEYARIDSFPYRHRVADLMSAPPLVVDGCTPLSAVLTKMVSERTGSLFIAPDPGTGEYGIITERDVLTAVAVQGGDVLNGPVAGLAQRPLVVVDSDEFVYRALTLMRNKGFRHLGVVGVGGVLVGAVSARDFLRQRADDAVSLGDSIETAASPSELGRLWSELSLVARTLLREGVDVRSIAAIISRELRALTRRAFELAEREMSDAGEGTAPTDYALLVLGSGGRGESLLAMDQDNAIVYADEDPGGKVPAWFAMVGTRMTEILEQAGVAYCKGGVMASNAAWRSDLTGWRAAIRAWISSSRPEDILNCDIFFDAIAVHGDVAMFETLHGEARQAASTARPFLSLMAFSVAEFRSAKGWFGRLRRENGRIDLKAGGLMPITASSRVVALRGGYAARSTPDRLRLAQNMGIVSPTTIDNLVEAHRILLDLILRQQLIDIDQGVALSNMIAPDSLAATQRKDLRWALDQVPSIADLLGTPLLP